MSGNSLAVLLAWMRNNPDLSEWDFISALSPGQLDTLLRAQYVQQLQAHNGVDGISGRLHINNSRITYHLFGYHLGVPQLVRDAASWQAPRLIYSVPVQDGLLVTVEGGEGVVSVSAHDALDSLALRYRSTIVGDGHRLVTDLALIDDVHFGLNDQAADREETAAFIKGIFKALPEDKRIGTLFEFPPILDNTFLKLRHLDLRTHASQADGQLAVVLFAALEYGPSGVYPVDGSGFPFLLPDELPNGQPASASVLLSRRLLYRATYANAMLHMLDSGEFRYRHEAQVLGSMYAAAGVLRGAETKVSTRDFLFTIEAFEVAAATGETPLGAVFDDAGVQMSWRSRFTLNFTYYRHGSSAPRPLLATFDFALTHRFDLCLPTREEAIGGLLMGYFLWPVDVVEITPVSGVGGLPPSELAQVNHAAGIALKQAILEGLSRHLTARIPERLLADAVLPGGTSLVAEHAEWPHGLALFGKAQGKAPWRIVDDYLPLAASAQHPFTIDTPDVSVQWSVSLMPGERGEPGRIDPSTGTYTAPPRHAMSEGGVKVKVAATEVATGLQSVGLITVLPTALTVNPLIQVCWYEDEVTLSAGTLGGELEWAVVNPQPGSGSLKEVDDPCKRIYVAGAKVDGGTYVLDEITIRDLNNDQLRSVHVLVRQKVSSLEVACEALAAGRMQFTAGFNGMPMDDVTWRVAVGSGEIDPRGRYEPGAQKDARFVLVTASMDSPFGLLEGHLIVVLDERWEGEALRVSAGSSQSQLFARG